MYIISISIQHSPEKKNILFSTFKTKIVFKNSLPSHPATSHCYCKCLSLCAYHAIYIPVHGRILDFLCAPPLMSSDLDRWLEEATCPKISLFSHLKCTSTLLPSALIFPPSPHLLGAKEGYKRGVMRGRGRCVQDGRVIMTPLL